MKRLFFLIAIIALVSCDKADDPTRFEGHYRGDEYGGKTPQKDIDGRTLMVNSFHQKAGFNQTYLDQKLCTYQGNGVFTFDDGSGHFEIKHNRMKVYNHTDDGFVVFMGKRRTNTSHY